MAVYPAATRVSIAQRSVSVNRHTTTYVAGSNFAVPASTISSRVMDKPTTLQISAPSKTRLAEVPLELSS